MEQNASLSLLPSAGGHIMAMRGGGVPMGFDPNASVIQLPPSANHVPIVDMKGGDETMAAAATVVTAPITLPNTAVNTPKVLKPIQFILFDEEFNDFSTASNESSKKILALLGEIKEDKQAVLQQIYDGIVNLRTSDLTTYPHFKRLLINMGLTYAKQKNKLKEEIVRPELTEIRFDFSKDVTVTLTIKCDQLPSCSKNNLALAAAATVLLQKGGEDTARTIRLFGKDYQFPMYPKDINGHLDLLKELEVEDKDTSFKVALLGEIYDGCYTDGSIITKIKCSTFGTLLEELGQKYAENMQKLLASGALPSRLKKKEESTSRKELPNGDIELTFTFSHFGKQLDAETQKKIREAVQKSTTSQSALSKLKHMISTVSSDQVSIHGMVSQKNACFCISALQFLFSIPHIRTAIKKHGCDDKVLAEILTQMHDPHDNMTEVNNDGVICALFNLFEALGEDISTFSKVTQADFKQPVEYEYLRYIMKNFFIHIGDPDGLGKQEAARDFISFLFEVCSAKNISITQLFEFTTKSTRDGSSTNEVALFWPLQLETDASGVIARFSMGDKTQPKQRFGTSLTRQEEFDGATREVTDTIELKTNPYLLIQTSIKSMDTGEMRYTNAGDLVRNTAGKPMRNIGERFDNVDLTAIPSVFTIGDKTFQRFGSIQYRGSGSSGHYIYTRYDLSSKKGIVYNDATLTLYEDVSTVPNPFPDYVLVYAEMGQEQKEAHFEEEAQKMEDLIRSKASASISLITKDINTSGGVDNNVNMHMLDFMKEGYMTGLDTTGLSGGGDKEDRWKDRSPVGDLLFFKENTSTNVKTKKNLSVADLCLMLKEYAQKTRIREFTKSTSMDILSSEMDKAKELYMESADDTIKKNALIAYVIFDILKELMEGIKSISKEELEAKSAAATAIQKNIAEKKEAKEKEGTVAAFKKKHPFLTDAPAENTAVPTAVAAAAATMSNESDATSEVLSAKSEINEKRQQENRKGRNGQNTELSSLPNSPLAAKKEQAASLLVSMRTLSDEIKELKQDPAQNSDKIRDKIYELTAMRSNVNEIQGINKSNSTNAEKILKEAMNATQPVDSASSNAANANRNENRPPVISESTERQASALPNENKYNEFKENNNNVSNNPTESVELKNLSSNVSAQSSNLASSASFVNKTRKSGQAVTAALEQERKEKEERKARYKASRANQEQRDAKVEKKATLSDKITDRLRIAQILKDKSINDPAVYAIKEDFDIDSEADKREIMDELLVNIGEWMGAIDRQFTDKSDPTYVSTYEDYIALLVTKSMIDAQMKNKSIPNESAKSIAKRLIDNYSTMKNPKKLSIEKMAEQMISQEASPQRNTKQAIAKQAIANKAMASIKNTTIQLDVKQLSELKSRIANASANASEKVEAIKEMHRVEMALMKKYINQMQQLKDAIKEIGPENASADLSAELDVILGRLQGVFSDDRTLKRDTYKTIAKDELELYKEGEVLRDKARFYMGLEDKKPEGSSAKEATLRARKVSPNLYKGGRRTRKKKRTLRASKKN